METVINSNFVDLLFVWLHVWVLGELSDTELIFFNFNFFRWLGGKIDDLQIIQ